MNVKSLTVGLVAVAALALRAGTWHVDEKSTAESPDGSAGAPYRTIQAAVDAAEASGDAELVVKVAPGTYASGERADSNGAKNRVVITKKLTLESTGSRDDTFIVGALDDSNAHGLGAGSVRGICVDGSAAAGTVIRGFAFRDCSASDSSTIGGYGGAVCFTEESGSVYVKDCSAVDCAACYGGAFCGVVAIRSLVKGCHNDNSGSKGSAMYKCKAYCCLIVSCGSKTSYAEYILQGDGPYVNCTAVGNNGSLLRCSASQLMYNSISTLASRQEFDGTNAGGANDIIESSNGGAKIANYKQAANNTDAFYSLLVAPMLGDYRPVAGGAAEEAGDSQWCAFDWIPEGDRNLDYFGNPRVVNGKLDAGAIQGAVPTVGGVLRQTEVVPTSATAADYNRQWYARGETWPTMLRITPPEGTYCCELWNDASGTLKTVRYADYDGGFWQTPPPEGAKWRMAFVPATATLWVDANSTAESPDGSEAAPYQTIQAAVDAAGGEATDYTIINVKPGTYEGATEANGCKSVVAIGKNVYLRAVGDGKPVIRGRLAAGTQAYGEGAVRCVAVDLGDNLGRMRVAIQGFRLENGSTTAVDSNQDDVGSNGGAVCAAPLATANNLYAQVLDCTIANCAGRYSLVRSVWLQRCVIADCLDVADSALRQSYATSCAIRNVASPGNGLVANDSTVVNCTIDLLAGGVRARVGSNSGKLYNTIAQHGTIHREIRAYGVYLHDLNKGDDTRGVPYDGSVTCTNENPQVNFLHDGRCPLLADSPAFGKWTVAEAKLADVAPWLDADFDGVPLQVTDGKVTPGAFQQAYEPKDVYANAAKADDSGDGLTPETAKRTLAAAMNVADCGDRIHVAAGRYAEGDMAQLTPVDSGSSFSVRARVVVPARATLVGAGADATKIVGGFAEDGEGALVRGVILGNDAMLKGVTVADGLCVTNRSAGDDSIAAGILASRSATVEDCVISNCWSYQHGAVYGGTFRRCVFRDNWAMSGAFSVGSAFALENCLAAGNRGSNLLSDYRRIDSCTFLYDNIAVGGNRIGTFGTYVGDAVINNSALILSPTTVDTKVPTLNNCLLPTIGSNSWRWKPLATTDCLLSEVTVSSSWNGIPDANYVGLDRGTNEKVPAELTTDLAGAQRIQNVAVDIGAYEFDWMATYSAAFSKRGWATVVGTEGTVRNDAAGIAVGADGVVKAKMARNPGRPVSVRATVTEGELVVRVNGEVIGSLTADVAKLWLGELAAGDVIELAFADQEGCAVVAGLKGEGGLQVIVR